MADMEFVRRQPLGEIPADVARDVKSLREIVMRNRADIDHLRRLPDELAQAFVERDLYRLTLPKDLGGRGVDALAQFDLTEEVASWDASVGWNFGIGTNSGLFAGTIPVERARKLFADPAVSVAASGAPQGRAVAVEGGYRVTGEFAWASGIYQSSHGLGGCFVYDGDTMRKGPTGKPVVKHVFVPKSDMRLIDMWHVGGMRGTGSTTFALDDVFVPEELAVTAFDNVPEHPALIFRLPNTYFGVSLSAVPLGTARATVAALRNLAESKTPPPPRTGLASQPFTQYAVAKAETMVNAARLNVRDAFVRMWREMEDHGEASMASRGRLRSACVHALEASLEAVQLCCRTAGGSALFENEPFERAMRDVNAMAGHLVFQRAMMEDAGRVAMGMPPLLPMF